ncbi:MAG: radical SAM family heme chaperone HemW [Balneola sp.]|nr:MAG: radical SAM family heme chaperone HemW [Balneola sp.]
MSGLYIHIPFCKQACSYCDFYFVTRQENKEAFVEKLIREIESRQGTQYADEVVQTVYLGGGTPSLLSAQQIERILIAIHETFRTELKELTLELNPDDATHDYLRELKSIGINRLSMGVQTFDASLLKFMNRAHTRDEALQSLEMLSKTGFDVFSVDLIYGNPGQTLKALEQDIQTLLDFKPPHISAYSLTIEPKTRLGKQYELGRLIPAEEEEVAQHFDLVGDLLLKEGIHQYEVSNFSKPGLEALHNSSYWSHQNYLGFGPGAHSFWRNNKTGKAERWSNEKNLISYLNNSWKKQNELEELGQQELFEERIMLGLRTIKGISRSELEINYGIALNRKQEEYIIQKEKEGLFEIEKDEIKPTKRGLRISDALILDLITLTEK